MQPSEAGVPIWGYREGKGFSGKNVTVKIKYSDFTQATRSKTSASPFANGDEILEVASGLLATIYPFKRSVRLLGVAQVSNWNSVSRSQSSNAAERPFTNEIKKQNDAT
ncbi:hypothetical protein GFL88_14085 [Rhizobium leguminosarum bv. viciae]|uniref:DinB/UmuC family translesion DNA polymerase n=1 Tax=Rhizobium leguminosarum TaxID=384 RepID=UPI0014422E0E|nr:hypothetical protein [Rhizobium leguminosarum bv. viciae]